MMSSLLVLTTKWDSIFGTLIELYEKPPNMTTTCFVNEYQHVLFVKFLLQGALFSFLVILVIFSLRFFLQKKMFIIQEILS